MLGYVTFHPSESLANSEDIRCGRTSIHDFFHNYLIIYRSVNMKTLEVCVEIVSYFEQIHDFVVRVDGKYRNRPGLRFLLQINASERHPRVTISIRNLNPVESGVACDTGFSRSESLKQLLMKRRLKPPAPFRRGRGPHRRPIVRPLSECREHRQTESCDSCALSDNPFVPIRW